MEYNALALLLWSTKL